MPAAIVVGVTSILSSTAASNVLKHVSGDASSTSKLAPEPLISERAETLGLKANLALEQSVVEQSVVEQNVVEQHVGLIKSSQRPEVNEAWQHIADREGLQKDVFDKATWDFLGFVFGRKCDAG